MSDSMRVVEVAIGLFAIVAIATVFMLPHRIRTKEFGDNLEAREAFRGNLIQTLTVVLVVIGAAVALEQLAASMDQLQEDRLSQVADEVETATARIEDAGSDEQARVDAITDLARLHSESPDHRFSIERTLLRFVQRNAELTDSSLASPQTQPSRDISLALDFLVTNGQEQLEPEWATMDEGRSLVLKNLDLRGIDLARANLIGADLSHTLLSGANLQQARMEGALLIGAQLDGARLRSAELRGSNLTEAKLNGASLTGAGLSGADLRGVDDLTWAQIRDASLDCSTQLPSMLANTDSQEQARVRMMLVLRECFLPTEMPIPANVDVDVLFGSLLSEAVVVQAPNLDIAVRIPNRTKVVPVKVHASEGHYDIRARADRSSVYIEGALVAEREPLPDSGASVAGSPVISASTPTPPAIATQSAMATTQTTSVLPEATPPESQGMIDPSQGGGCDPSYPDVCIPPMEQFGDLDCADIEARLFRVLPPDPHGFDGNFDGIACEPVYIAPTEGPDRDCADFATQEEAQAFFEAAGGPELDPYRLDIDGDGIACSTPGSS